MGKTYFKSDSLKKFLDYYNKILSVEKESADAYYGRALCMRYYDKKKAYEDFKRAFRYNRKFKERGFYYYGLINFYIENSEFKKAMKITDKFYNSCSCYMCIDEKECLMRKALILALCENYDEALKVIEIVENIDKEECGWFEDTGVWDLDFFYCSYDILRGNIYLVRGEYSKAYFYFASDIVEYENRNSEERISHNDFILVPLYLFTEKKEKFLERVNQALNRNDNKGYFYSWYAAYAKKYENDEKAKELLIKAIENGYINEGILKSKILQGYFLRDFFKDKKISDYFKFEL